MTVIVTGELFPFAKRERLPLLEDLSQEQYDALSERQKANITHVEKLERRLPGWKGVEGKTYWITLIWLLGKKHPLKWKKAPQPRFRRPEDSDQGRWITHYGPVDEIDGSIPLCANKYHKAQ